ncbi:MAG: response regulator [Dehalococcoidia bacterium]
MATILVVDATAESRNRASNTLFGEGHNVITVATGPEAMLRIRNNPPDLVLLDVTVLGEDGWDVLRQVRMDPMTVQLPVITIVRSSASDADSRKATLLYSNERMLKPWDAEELRNRVGWTLWWSIYKIPVA